MNLAELRILTLRYQKRIGSISEIPEDATVTDWINQALRFLGQMVWLYTPSASFGLTINDRDMNLSGVAFSKRMLTVDSVVINGQPLQGYGRKSGGMYSWAEFNAEFPLWRTTAAAVPAAACVAGDMLLLCPPPDGAYSNNFVAGRYMPAALSSDSAEPDIPSHLHEALAAVAAVLGSFPSASTEEAMLHLKQLDERAATILKEEADRSREIYGRNHAAQIAGGAL